MQINDLKLKIKRKKRKTIGRGGKKGTYSGKGNKGQKARSGAHVDPLFEGGRSTLIDHMKKKKGFKSKKTKFLAISLENIEKKFKDGETIDINSLTEKGLIGKIKFFSGVKILGKFKKAKKLLVSEDIFVSNSAKDEIKKAGGEIAGDQQTK